jgi:uncharacterized protein (TIGR00730 family)
MKRLCVFCGSAVGTNPVYRSQACALGELLARQGWGLVFGGGHIGLMGVLADAVLGAGGEVIGVIPQALVDRELAHTSLTELRIVGSMHERKALMADLSDAFLALPGGYGTADELFEILTWAQLGIHHKPIGLLNTMGFFDSLLGWIDRAVAEGFIRRAQRTLVLVESDLARLLEGLTRREHAP